MRFVYVYTAERRKPNEYFFFLSSAVAADTTLRERNVFRFLLLLRHEMRGPWREMSDEGEEREETHTCFVKDGSCGSQFVYEMTTGRRRWNERSATERDDQRRHFSFSR